MWLRVKHCLPDTRSPVQESAPPPPNQWSHHVTRGNEILLPLASTLAPNSYSPQNEHCIFFGCISISGPTLLHSHHCPFPLLGSKFSSLFRADLSPPGWSDSFPLGSPIYPVQRPVFCTHNEHTLSVCWQNHWRKGRSLGVWVSFDYDIVVEFQIKRTISPLYIKKNLK